MRDYVRVGFRGEFRWLAVANLAGYRRLCERCKRHEWCTARSCWVFVID
jgi:hypothetical protein